MTVTTIKTKKPPAPRSRPWDLQEGMWRTNSWRLPTRKYRMSSRLSVGLPDEMKAAIRYASWETGLSMAEVARRLFAQGGI